MMPDDTLTRRAFLGVGAQGAAALVVGFYLPACGGTRETTPGRAGQAFTPNAWIRITADDRITILVEKPELGQGSRTYTAMMVAEELEADWSTIRVVQAPTVPAIYKELRTAGSGGVESTYLAMRQAGAQARELLRTAAARHWGVPRQDCRAVNGAIVLAGTGRRLSFGALASAAAALPALAPTEIPLKAPEQFRLIGRAVPRLDLPAKVDGSATFGIDVRVPGLLFAVIARCPYFGGRLRHVDATRARRVPGVHAVFPVAPLPRRFNTAGGVAVVADSSWSAVEGRRELVLAWDRPAGEPESTAGLRRVMERAVLGPATFVAVDRGDVVDALRGASRVLEADYESPFQAHATMEPMNTTVDVREREIEVWSPTQFADEVQREIAELAGVALDRVIVHMTLSGGSFGRRYQWDVPAEAWQVANVMRRPVQVMWTREDDFQHDFYRPHNRQRLRAGLDTRGRLVAWSTRIVTTPIAATNLYTGYTESPETLRDPATIAALEWYGGDIAPYAIPNFRLDYAPADSVVPRSWWRSVASSYTPFAEESFMDELAHALGRDPLRFRLDLLTPGEPDADRLRRVLRLAAEQAGWGTPLPAFQGRGLACRVNGTCSAQVAHVAVDPDGSVRVLRVVSAVDCGLVISPDGVRAMTEGAINFALTAVLTGAITVKDGAVEQSNFHDYRVLRLSQAPDIDVQIVSSTAPPSGVGELGAMLAGPAVANAVFAATGVRVRRLPIESTLLRRT